MSRLFAPRRSDGEGDRLRKAPKPTKEWHSLAQLALFGTPKDVKIGQKKNLAEGKMTEKKSFVMYYDFYEQFCYLTFEQRGKLMTAAFEYAMTGETQTELAPIETMAFLSLKQAIDRDSELYRSKCEQRSLCGKKGGRPKKEEASEPEEKQKLLEESKKTKSFFEKAKKADNDNDNENDNGNDNGNENENDNANANGNGVKEAEQLLCVSEGVSDSISEPISDDISEPVSDLAPLTEEDRIVLLQKGIPSRYVAEREARATDYARSHGDTALNVLLSWWQSDRLSPKYAEPQRAEYPSAPRPSPPPPVSNGIKEKAWKEASVGDRSFDVNDFFAAAVMRSIGEP